MSAPIPKVHDLHVPTTAGIVHGFIDTFPLSVFSKAKCEQSGGRRPVRKWLGIPYAQAERWERPRQPQNWTGVRDCFEFGPSFPQSINPFDKLYKDREGWMTREHLGQSEDAFTVNVFAPEEDCKNLPVLFWLYGGNLNSGSSNFPIYDPTEFVRRQAESGMPCIVVTGNYRVGILGWLATEDLKQVNHHPGNFGLYDAISMLKWVRSNIERFGGDSNNVTAFGESAGAFLLAMLLHSGRKLFNKVILQSGNHALMALRPTPHFAPYDALLDLLDIQRYNLNHVERVQRLKEVPTDELQEKAAQVFTPGIWGMTVDLEEQGWTTPMWKQLEEGLYDPWIDSVIIGINEDEGTFFNDRAQFWKSERMIKLISARGFDEPTMYSRIAQLYPSQQPSIDMSDFRSTPSSTFYYDMSYVTPMLHLATTLTSVPNYRTGNTINVYVYHCRTIAQTLLRNLEHLGILHTGEIPFVMNAASLWNYDENSADAQTAALFGRCWADFATRGDPGWEPFNTTNGSMIVFKDGGHTHTEDARDLRRQHREFWHSLFVRKFMNPGRIAPPKLI